jgi:hypothetical protein
MYPTMLRQSVLWPTLGNHDGETANSSTGTGPYYNIFTLPKQGEAGGFASGTEAYFSFDYGNIHFVNLESFETNRAVNGPMMTWLQNDLASTAQKWIIAYWHHPPYSKGSHDSDVDIESIEMRENALPILEAYGVDLVLAGHSHSYERSFLIDGHYGPSTTLTAAMKKDGGSGQVENSGVYIKPTMGVAANEGAVYAVAGSSGQIDQAPLDHPAMFVSMSVLGSMALDFTCGQLNASFIDNTGVIRDHFTIQKGFVSTILSPVMQGRADPSPSPLVALPTCGGPPSITPATSTSPPSTPACQSSGRTRSRASAGPECDSGSAGHSPSGSSPKPRETRRPARPAVRR